MKNQIITSNEILDSGFRTKDGFEIQPCDLLVDEQNWRVEQVVFPEEASLDRRRHLVPTDMVKDNFSYHSSDHFSDQIHDSTTDLPLTLGNLSTLPTLSHRPPISEKLEAGLREFFGWPPKWMRTILSSVAPILGVPNLRSAPPKEVVQALRGILEETDHADLLMVGEISDYKVLSRDGIEIDLSDLVIDPKTWTMKGVVLESSPFKSHPIFCPSIELRSIDLAEKTIHLGLTGEQIVTSPRFDPSQFLPKGEAAALNWLYHGK